MNGKVCAFFGHRSVIEKGDLESEVYSVVKELINSGFSTFMFGGFGEFDELCHKVVSRLKTENQHIKRVYCLTDEKFLRESKRPKY